MKQQPLITGPRTRLLVLYSGIRTIDRKLKLAAFAIALIVLMILGKIDSKAQTGYSGALNDYLMQIHPDSLIYSVKKLSGELPVMVNGEQTIIANRIWDSEDNHRAAQYIAGQFEAMGYQVEFDQFSDEGYNVVASRTGIKFPEHQFIMCAHYDNVAYEGGGVIAPGADDNATGVVAMLKAAEIFTHFAPHYSIKFIAFDAEEAGMVGSMEYVANAFANGDSIVGVINMDMLGWDHDNDSIYLAVRNSQSQNMMDDFISIADIYVPGMHPEYSSIWYSDHSSFWNSGYTAINIIEQHGGDFNPYYHSIFDRADSLNKNYFQALTRASIAGFITLVNEMYIHCNHQPLESQMITMPRQAVLYTESEHPFDGINNPPLLYYSVNGGDFNVLTPLSSPRRTLKTHIGTDENSIDDKSFKSGAICMDAEYNTYYNYEWNFEIPGALQGDKIEYFFEVSDSAGLFMVTYPYGGFGINQPPAQVFTYYVADLTVKQYCSTSEPKLVTHTAPVYDTIFIDDAGLLTDINVITDVKHTYDADLTITLIDPAGTELILCRNNGEYGNNYSITRFDDQAELRIDEGAAPFNGSYRPIDSLMPLEYHPLNGNWVLKIEDNSSGDNGQLDYWCVEATWSADFLTGIPDEGSDKNIETLVWPNPASDYITVKLKGAPAGNRRLSICDMAGRVMLMKEMTGNEIKLDVGDFARGIYVIRIETHNRLIQNKLIID